MSRIPLRLIIIMTALVLSVSVASAAWSTSVSPDIDSPTAATAVVLNESFESGVLPAGWLASAAPSWSFNNPGTRTNTTGGTGNFAIADSDIAGAVDMNASLLTPALDLTGQPSVKLTFKSTFQAYETSTASVSVSVNGGVGILLWSKTGASYQGTTTLDVPQAANQSNVRFFFSYTNANYDYWWELDDVKVEGMASGPAAPSDLSAFQLGNVFLNWTDNSSDEANFIIERSPDGATSWVEAGRVGANTSLFTHSNVTCGTTVHYRVKAINGALESSYSNTANITTPVCPPSSSGINENFDASTSLPAGWTVASGSWVFTQPNTTGGTGNAPYGNPVTSELRTPVFNMTGVGAVLLTFKTDISIYSGQNLVQKVDVAISQDAGATWTNVWEKASAYKGAVALDVSQWAANHPSLMVRFVTTLPYGGSYWQIDDVVIEAMPAPTLPTDFTTMLTGVSDVLFSWHGSDGAKYKLERSADSGATWSQIADLADGATTYVDSTTASFTAYQYRVQAYNTAGQSAFTAPASVTTGDKSVRYLDVSIALHAGAILATAADRAKYENVIGYFADALFEASNGVERLRKVTFYRDFQNVDSSHFQWVPECHPNGTLGGYLHPGTNSRILMCDTFGTTDLLSATVWPGQKGAGATMTHEWGHFFFGLYDEYQGSGTGDSSPQAGDPGTSQSIMNSQWDGFDDLRHLNFSTVAPSSGFTLVSAQGRVFGASAWDTLARPKSADPQTGLAALRPYWPELAAAKPTANTMPQIDLPNPLARATLNIVWQPAFSPTAVDSPNAIQAVNSSVREIVIDRSALMADSGHLEEVKIAVAALINRTPIGDALGIIAFDGTHSVIQPLTDIVDQTTRDTLIAAVNGITAGGADASGYAGLEAALSALTAPTVPTDTDRVVYYITHGGNTVGTHAIMVTPGYQAAGIPMHIFGFDPLHGDETELRQLADLTAGEYTVVRNALDLRKALTMAHHDTSPHHDVTVAYDKADVAAGQTFTTTVALDHLLREIDFEITYLAEPAAATVTLFNPLGNPYPIIPANDCESYGAGADAHTTCRVAYQSPIGDWTLSVTAASDLHLQYHVTGIASDGVPTYDASISTLGGDVVEYPNPIVAYASVNNHYSIAGLAAKGEVHEADGHVIPVDFHDDGVAPDDMANDGIYSAYVDYTEAGEHWVTVEFDNFAGTAFYTDEGLSVHVHQELPAVTEDFERYAEHQVTIINWDEDDHTDWPTDPDWPPTPVTTDNVVVPGRIDYEGDADIFQITVPTDYTEPTLSIRINGFGLGMDPDIWVFADDYSWEHEHYLIDPTSDDVLFLALDVTPGETFYLEVLDYHGESDGVYNVSAGPHLWSDPVPREKHPYKLLLPIIFR